jgi:hypothetical protein
VDTVPSGLTEAGKKTGQMKVIRRLALHFALPLTVAVAAGYSWYRLSDTGKGWRYEDRLATFCHDLIPYEESALFTDLDIESGLAYDSRHGGANEGYDYCRVADIDLAIARVPDSATGVGSEDLFNQLHGGSADAQLIPSAAAGAVTPTKQHRCGFDLRQQGCLGRRDRADRRACLLGWGACRRRTRRGHRGQGSRALGLRCRGRWTDTDTVRTRGSAEVSPKAVSS